MEETKKVVDTTAEEVKDEVKQEVGSETPAQTPATEPKKEGFFVKAWNGVKKVGGATVKYTKKGLKTAGKGALYGLGAVGTVTAVITLMDVAASGRNSGTQSTGEIAGSETEEIPETSGSVGEEAVVQDPVPASDFITFTDGSTGESTTIEI